ncbi:MAG TPA: radical SAM protein [Candidatus Hydrogenedentes bacterium]|nr:radical SAM protein [Candidatus Hydrogenedentota bacterium]HPG65743.1 radical SAM protein [Candidatus Hydrogenedentota bacterium]
MEDVVRKTQSLCPVCARDVEGAVVVSEGKAYLTRRCPEHGSYRFLLSEHGELYADLDRFFTKLKAFARPDRVTNVWILVTSECQQDCPYCSAEIRRGLYGEMTWPEVLGILDKYGDVKYTISGGEPTLYPHVLDFFREAARRGYTTQLATNGVRLASREFCRELKEAGVREVRISLESVHREEAEALNLGEYFEPKLEAIRNIGEEGMVATLSPTIFKGLNEEQLFHILEYAKDKPYIRELTVAGFAWNGTGVGLPPGMMIAPDEMMDVIHRHYYQGDRKDLFTFQKAMFAILHVRGFRLCLNSQVMIFARDKGGELRPIIDFVNMRRMDKGLGWWSRLGIRNRWLGGALLLPVLAAGLSLRTVPLIPTLLHLLWANLAQLDVHRYPARLVALIVNTNCSTLNADEMVGPQCMNGVAYKIAGQVEDTNASKAFLSKEISNRASGVWEETRSPESRDMMSP